MVGAIQPEESRADALAGIDVQRRVLDRDQRVLVLQASARQRFASRSRSCSASVANDVALRSEPITHHGLRPSAGRFCREATAQPRDGCWSGV